MYETDLSLEMAMRLVFTCGTVMPEYVSLARLPKMTEGEKTESPASYYTGRFQLEADMFADRGD